MRISRLFLLVILITTLTVAGQDSSHSVKLEDRSDWWSVLNDNFDWPGRKPVDGELRADNFEIEGIKFERDPLFRAIEERLGRAVPARRTNGIDTRYQICYTAEHNSGLHLIFEESDSNLNFYLFQDTQSWNGEALCAESSRVSPSLHTNSGLRLGISLAEVEQVLGKADLSSPDRLVYYRESERRTTDERMAELRKQHPDLTEQDLRDTYDSYQLELYIQARFTDGKLTYLAASQAEIY